jgi:hypothetical protein
VNLEHLHEARGAQLGVGGDFEHRAHDDVGGGALDGRVDGRALRVARELANYALGLVREGAS